MRTLFLALLLLLPLSAQEPLEPFIEKAMRQYDIPGCSVALIQNGQVTMLRGFGLRRLGTSEPVGPDTIFPLASVTKTYTGVLAGTVVQDGKLGWDQPVVEVMPQVRLSQDYPTLHVTVTDFLSHRSGLPAFTGDLFDRLGYSHEEVIRRIQFLPLSAGFREHDAYSNVGFFLAGMTCARAAGVSWEDLVQQKILTPLKLSRTGFFTGPIPPGADIASPHMGKKPLPEFDPQTVLGPAGLMTSTARDMSRLVLMLLNQGELDGVRILTTETVEHLFTPAMVAEPGFADMAPIFADSGFSYGMGVGIYHYNGYQIIEKGGARAGVRSLLTLVPEKKLGLVILCNQSATAFPEAVRARVLENELGPARQDLQSLIWQQQLKVDKMLASVPVEAPGPPAVTRPSPLPLESYLGQYENPLYGTLKVTRKGSHLAWAIGPAGYGGPLYLEGLTTFLMVEPAGQISIPGEATFVVNEKGEVLSVQTDYGVFVKKKSI